MLLHPCGVNCLLTSKSQRGAYTQTDLHTPSDFVAQVPKGLQEEACVTIMFMAGIPEDLIHLHDFQCKGISAVFYVLSQAILDTLVERVNDEILFTATGLWEDSPKVPCCVQAQNDVPREILRRHLLPASYVAPSGYPKRAVQVSRGIASS